MRCCWGGIAGARRDTGLARSHWRGVDWQMAAHSRPDVTMRDEEGVMYKNSRAATGLGSTHVLRPLRRSACGRRNPRTSKHWLNPLRAGAAIERCSLPRSKTSAWRSRLLAAQAWTCKRKAHSRAASEGCRGRRCGTRTTCSRRGGAVHGRQVLQGRAYGAGLGLRPPWAVARARASRHRLRPRPTACWHRRGADWQMAARGRPVVTMREEEGSCPKTHGRRQASSQLTC